MCTIGVMFLLLKALMVSFSGLVIKVHVHIIRCSLSLPPLSVCVHMYEYVCAVVCA